MITAERQLPIIRFERVPDKKPDPDHDAIIGMLDSATEVSASVSVEVNPTLWYGNVYQGPFSGPKWEEFRREYDNQVGAKVLKDPRLAALEPYSAVSAKFELVPIVSSSRVRTPLERLADQLRAPIDHISTYHPRERGYREFLNYLRTAQRELPQGNFAAVISALLKVPSQFPIVAIWAPLENYTDPMGKRASFDGCLAESARQSTEGANNDARKFRMAAQDKFSLTPLDARIFVTRAILFTGYYSSHKNGVSAFNIPNDRRISEEAGNNLICLFLGRIASKYRHSLSPLLQENLGIQSKSISDALNMVIGHEQAHGVQFPDEYARLGEVANLIREMSATLQTVAEVTTPHFKGGYAETVARGSLMYALEDAGHLRPQLFEPLGVNQPTLEQLRTPTDYYDDSYGPGSYAYLRRLALEGVIVPATNPRRVRCHYERLFGIADEITRELLNIEAKGDSQTAINFLDKLLEERRGFPGYKAPSALPTLAEIA